MFGFRTDGKALRHVDPIIKMTPLLMKDRCDAQVFTSQSADWEILDTYIKEKRKQGIKITRMALVLAAYIRAVSQRPEVNRFVVNKRIYVRKDISISFALLKKRTAEEVIETTVKLHFDPTETVFTVAEKLNEIIETESKITSESLADKIAGAVLSIPLLPRVGVNFLMWLDKIGLLPKAIIEASPFHTSMFITNMASIKMNAVNHHIYNFGTTSMFISMGRREERAFNNKGTIQMRSVLPLGMVIDERVCSGATYAMALHLWESYLRTPHVLEQPPAMVRYDDGVVYGRGLTDPTVLRYGRDDQVSAHAHTEDNEPVED